MPCVRVRWDVRFGAKGEEADMKMREGEDAMRASMHGNQKKMNSLETVGSYQGVVWHQ